MQCNHKCDIPIIFYCQKKGLDSTHKQGVILGYGYKELELKGTTLMFVCHTDLTHLTELDILAMI
jgi:hypothetical protein